MSNCTCGRTTRPPFCDGSHTLSEDAYRERTLRLEKLFGKLPPDTKPQKEQNITQTNSRLV